MASQMRIVINDGKLRRAVSSAERLDVPLDEAVGRIADRANALSASFRTGIYHDHETGEVRGNTQPRYAGDVIRGKTGFVGIVHPANYAAMKDNHENNTLLKSV